MTDYKQIKEEWEKRFDKEFFPIDDKNWHEPLRPTPKAIKSFIEKSLFHQRSEIIKEDEKWSTMMIKQAVNVGRQEIIKEIGGMKKEVNSNIPENNIRRESYNQALSDVIEQLKK